ncbi:MAG: hypothetical protein PHG08_00960 [Bacilli bacterium]|nr:hypothetical protein [Bacilli bacterium]
MKNNTKLSLSLLALAIALLFIPIQQAKSDYTEQKLNTHVSVLVTEKNINTTIFDLLIDGNTTSIISANCDSKIYSYLPINGLPDGEEYIPFYIPFKNVQNDENIALKYICEIS